MIEAMKHYEAALLKAFPRGATGDVFEHWNKARQAIAEAEKKEPVAWTDENFMEIYISQDVAEDMCDEPPIPLYIHPKQWVGLTDEEIEDCYREGGIGRAARLLKEKNT